MWAPEELRTRDRSASERGQPDDLGGGAPEAGKLLTLPEIEDRPVNERRLWRKSDLSVHLAEEGWGWMQDEDDGCLLKGGWSMPHAGDQELDQPPWY